jgi:hypothetical protein
MTESMPPTRVQMQKLRKDLTEKVLDKACSDSEWKRKLIEDPELALREANFPELQQIQQASREGEVQGQGGYDYWSFPNVYYHGGPYQLGDLIYKGPCGFSRTTPLGL